MTSPNPVTGNTYVNQYINYELSEEELRMQLTRRDTQLSTSLNFKTNGIYETIELQNGEQFFTVDNSSPKRFVYRKVIPIPTSVIIAGVVTPVLPIAPGTSTPPIPHGITGVTLFTRIYGIAVTATDWRPIPNSDIKIVVTSTTYTITNEATSAAITSGMVILEYVKQ